MHTRIDPTAEHELAHDNRASVRSAGRAPAQAGDSGPIRLLVFTSLYPNAAQPRHGIFVEARVRQLVATGKITATVVAPVPWFPFRHRHFGRYGTFARVPARETRHGIDILHPRYPVIPKLGMNMAPALMYGALLPTARRLVRCNAYDLIDAHYFYPDGVAAVRLGSALKKPVVVTARGSDLNVLPRYRAPRRQIQRAARDAAAVITVSRALAETAAELGISRDKVSILRNGVDLERFKPLDRGVIRKRLSLAGTTWLCVGNLVELKGVHIVLAALARVPEAMLLVAGEGPQASHLQQLTRDLTIAGRVRFLRNVPHESLPDYYNAADALMLASSREGMPNAALESLACGTPVIAAPFAGAREVIDSPDAGEIAEARTAEAIVQAWQRLDTRQVARAATRQYAEQWGWESVIDKQCALYASVLASDARMRSPGEPA